MLDSGLKAFLLFLTVVVLLYASAFDIRTKLIKPRIIGILLILGGLYYIVSNGNIINLIVAELLITFIFLIPAIFGMGWGDMYLLWSLGLFFGEDGNVELFLAIFLISASVWIIYYIDKYGVLKRNRKEILRFSLPFVPPITVGFIGWAVLQFC